ncbi:MAG: polysaccharide pyruvyl transferase family protein [Deltaproteobacteria bacterium]|nr:polysaccharide pyruvyl transferase family protein [Deltaproteobacteria bacterium]
MRVFFVGDNSDNPNWGCRSTSLALRRMVEESGGEIAHTLFWSRMGKRDRYVPGKVPRLIEHLLGAAVDSIPRARGTVKLIARRAFGSTWDRISGAHDTVPRSFAEFEPFAEKVIKDEIFQPERRALEECDLVVINGEGSIYDTQRTGRMNLFIAYLAKRHFGKPCILVNHTADIGNECMAEMVSRVYPLLDDIVFREHLSAEKCSAFVRGDNSTLGADAAFTYRPAKNPAWSCVAAREGYFSVWPDSASGFNPLEPYVCVGGSSIYLRPDRPQYDPVPGFIALCEMLQKKVGQVLLTAPCTTDEKIFRPISRELHLPLIGLATPTQQAVDILGHARAYVSGRWHPSIFALTGGTPIVTLTANTFKTDALNRQAGLEGQTFDALKLHEEIEPIVELTRTYVTQGEALRRRLRNRVRSLSKLAWRNVRYLRDSMP